MLQKISAFVSWPSFLKSPNILVDRFLRMRRVSLLRQGDASGISKEVCLDFLALFEASLVLLSAFLAKTFYVDYFLGYHQPEIPYLGVGVLGMLFAYFIMQQRGHYKPDQILSDMIQPVRILRALSFAFFLLVSTAFFLKIADDYSRVWLLSWFVLSFLIISFTRKIAISWLSSLADSGLFNKRVVVIGDLDMCNSLVKHIKEHDIHVDLMRVYPLPGDIEGGKTLARALTDKMRELVLFGQDKHIDQIIVALPSYGKHEVQEIQLRLGQLTARIDFFPGEAALYMKRPEISHLGDVGLYNLQKHPITEWGVFAKRTLDIVVSSLALSVLALPMILIAVLIRLGSPGKCLFIQKRHGLNGKVIHVMKFRSMTDKDRNKTVHQVKKGDNDVTPIGGILRKTSLDELPQLLNVLRGDMSLVGPRPHPVALNEKFSDVVQLSKNFQRLECYAARHKVKPGITGWAQVNGARGETDTREKMEKRVKYDLHYINDWSIWLDFKILVKTVEAVIRGENAH